MPARSALRLSTLSLALAVSACAFAQETAPQPATTPAKPVEGLPAVRTVVRLHTSLSSKSTAPGSAVEGIVDKTTQLADGTRLQRGSLLMGKVVQVSRHTKALPNGALMLTFDRVVAKGTDPIPVLAKMRDLEDPAQEQTTMPGAKLGGTSNSGGTQQLAYERNDTTTGAITTNSTSSHVKGVHLESKTLGSGVIYAVGEDVFLDSGILITLSVARAPAP